MALVNEINRKWNGFRFTFIFYGVNDMKLATTRMVSILFVFFCLDYHLFYIHDTNKVVTALYLEARYAVRILNEYIYQGTDRWMEIYLFFYLFNFAYHYDILIFFRFEYNRNHVISLRLVSLNSNLNL